MTDRIHQGSDALAKARAALVLLREQAAMFAKLALLARKQHDMVSQEDTGPLLALLAERQRITIGLTDVGTKLEPARRDWVTTRNALTPPERSEADGLVTQVRERMRQLIETDERDTRVLSARREVVAGTLRDTQRVGQAVSAYRPSQVPQAGTSRLDEAS